MKTRITDWRAYTFQPKHPERTVFKNAPGLGVDIFAKELVIGRK